MRGDMVVNSNTARCKWAAGEPRPCLYRKHLEQVVPIRQRQF